MEEVGSFYLGRSESVSITIGRCEATASTGGSSGVIAAFSAHLSGRTIAHKDSLLYRSQSVSELAHYLTYDISPMAQLMDC